MIAYIARRLGAPDQAPRRPHTVGLRLPEGAGRRQAVLSSDGGATWDLDNEVVLRDDGGYPSSLKKDMTGTLRPPPGRWQGDVGYPVSVQLPDYSILTAYYTTESDGITHTAVTRWET